MPLRSVVARADGFQGKKVGVLYKIHPYGQVQLLCKPFVLSILGASLVFLVAVLALIK